MKKIQFLVFSLVVILSVSPSFANRGSGKPENCSVGIWAEDGKFWILSCGTGSWFGY